MTAKYIRLSDYRSGNGYTSKQIASMIYKFMEDELSEAEKKEFYLWVSKDMKHFHYLGSILDIYAFRRLNDEMGLIDEESFIKMYGKDLRLPKQNRLKKFFVDNYHAIRVYISMHWYRIFY